ncbi:MAG: glycoside hydrolase TIM-barrel-like domain-containing protein [Rhodobacteraceae bacterium]|nr:glycoside hydrolase TIM-barrel-like domain-containing protein [Paracoccaceae bacterium]
MATIVLSAVGAAVGGSFGGTVLGLTGAVIGRAVGATVGRVIDQRLLGVGAEPVETGRVDRFRLTGASEGAPVPLVHGRMRVGGHVIWASQFQETSTRRGGGKGAPQPRTVEYGYSVSLAIALGDGEIARVGRIWADGTEIARDDVTLHVYPGSETQLPDPQIEAVEGAGRVPAYRGTAYVVIEDLDLAPFGNRVPQFSFEVFRRAAVGDAVPDLADGVQAVALIPGTGEFALATTPVHRNAGPGANVAVNVNTPSGLSDLATSLAMLREELPACGSVALVVSWFGDDLRCGECRIRPKVERADGEGQGMIWRVGGMTRAAAEVVAEVGGRPVYGGTPADDAVLEAIAAIHDGGQSVMFYPFLLMEQLAGNGLTDPWTGASDQPVLPWRGRITLSVAPGRAGSPDRTAGAEAEVAAFFGAAVPGDFSVAGGRVSYTGDPDDHGLRRMILHYAHLCALAGGVAAFCIGSELRGLTQIRGAGDSFPAVAALRALAADVRVIVGPATKIGYAADWSEYSGYDAGGGDRYFHLDALWADANVDFVGIDNYMPLSDWRDGEDHADSGWETVYNLDYLRANVAGGELHDWYYASEAERDAQRRTPITDGAHGEPWVWRQKDIRNWWMNRHHDRIGGERQAVPTAWEPQSKPVWFTEFGCPAVDKGTNQPNVFVDPKSSESALPRYSSGRRDDLIQRQYIRATLDYWGREENNPLSTVYGAPMVDMGRAHLWAWDARPHPHFPGNLDLWADGENWTRGHWISGRTAAEPLARVVRELCARSGVTAVEVSELHGLVRGYVLRGDETARQALQPLALAYGFDPVERDGTLRFRPRGVPPASEIDPGGLAIGEHAGAVEAIRVPVAEVAGRLRLVHVEADGDYEVRSAEAIFPDEATYSVATSELALALTGAEARGIVERWLAESRVGRDSARFALPPSAPWGVGDVVRLDAGGGTALWRIDRLEDAGPRLIEAVRVEPSVYRPSDAAEERVMPRPFVPPVPVFPLFMDLPLVTGDEVAHAPHIAVTAKPWPGSVAVYSAAEDAGYVLNRLIGAPSTVGVTLTPLQRAPSGRWDRGAPLRVRLTSGTLASASPGAVYAGANLMAIGDGSSDGWELFQFTEAVLVGPGVYDLALRLRGQAGTDGVTPEVWPEGSYVVRWGPAVTQVELASSQRGLVRHYRIGPAGRPVDDPAYLHRVEAFAGNGLRPYSPCHLRVATGATGELTLGWVRRTRIDGDSWSTVEVPLGEEREQYLVRVRQAAQVVREVLVEAPQWIYPLALRLADGVTGETVRLEVAQLSDHFGSGPFAGIDVQA